MKILNLIQGTPEWHAHRATARNASEAPAVLGFSKYTSRDELLKQKATGLVPDVDDATQSRFDDGHEAEAKARPKIEEIIGDDLYPATATSDDEYLSASFDGVTIEEAVFWENKLFNQSVAQFIENNEDLPDSHWPQVEQQFLVSGSEKCLFTLCDRQGDVKVSLWYESRPERRAQVLAGWKQFDEDLANYQHVEEKVAPIGRAPEMLPALRIEVTGMVTASNLQAFKEHALAVFQSINTDLQTDEDFANAEKTVKWCGDVEDRLDAAKQHALSQTASIDDLFRAIDQIKAEARAKRLELDKLVKGRKESIRVEIQQEGVRALQAHIQTINHRLSPIKLPEVKADFAGAMKGKKTIASLRDAVNTTLANAKIEASRLSELIGSNLMQFEEIAADYKILFFDLQALVVKPEADFEAIVKGRIADHKAEEQKRIDAERERIRKEEQDKLAAAQAAQDAVQKAAEPEPVDPVEKPGIEMAKAAEALYSPQRPTDGDIIRAVAKAFNASPKVAAKWIMEINQSAAEVA